MDTKEGMDLLQIVADTAADWHDSIATVGIPGESTVLMTALLDAQNHMLHGRRLHRHPIDARVLFNRWTATYDDIFKRGYEVGVVPSDP